MQATSTRKLPWTLHSGGARFALSLACLASIAVAAESKFQERLLLVDINRQHINQTVMLLEDASGALLASGADLQRWRLRLPGRDAAVEYQGTTWYSLAALAAESQIYDATAQTLTIEVGPEAFTATSSSAPDSSRPHAVRSGPGGFFNYDVFAAQGAGSTQHAGQFELGYFDRHGVGTTTVLADDSAGSRRATRLETTWTTDDPDKLQSLRLGDAIITPGSWGREVRFGGIQFGTNFGTQPGFVTFPQQSAAGVALLPSTVDVLVNNALVARQTVPPGPFTISNLPVVTGQGDVRLVVRDLFGREQLITRPFYASQSLLRAGLANFSYEVGTVRNNFGINSNDYGSAVAVGTYRRGLSDHLTTEVRGEATPDHATAGAGGDYLVPDFGTVSTYLATSHSAFGNGILALLGLDRQAQPWSFGARSQWTTSRFSEIGLQSPALPPIQSSSFNLSYATVGKGSVGVAYVTQHNRDTAAVRFASVNYSVSVQGLGLLSVSALHNLAGDVSTTLFALLSIPLDTTTSLTLSSQSTRGGRAGSSDDFTATLQRNLPPGTGYGYRLLARTDGSQEASYALQDRVGTYTVDAARNQGSTSTRLDVAGGVAVLGQDVFLTRRIDQSFAVARIPDYANFRVLADNQPVGRTDTHGNALIPQLRAYDVNVISVDQRDIPLDAEISALTMDAVPYFRSGIDVRFPIHRSYGATLTIQLDDGSRLPVGAVVEQVGKPEHYPVANDGDVYVLGLAPITRLRARWRGQSCEFEVRMPASSDPLPDLGLHTCSGVKP